jgi:hypothetical protein
MRIFLMVLVVSLMVLGCNGTAMQYFSRNQGPAVVQVLDCIDGATQYIAGFAYVYDKTGATGEKNPHLLMPILGCGDSIIGVQCDVTQKPDGVNTVCTDLLVWLKQNPVAVSQIEKDGVELGAWMN